MTDRGYWLMPQFGSDGSVQLITSPGLCCPLLPVGGLLIGRGHLVSSNVVRSVNQSEIEPCEPEGSAGLPTVQILGSPEVREVPEVIQDLYCILSPLQNISPFLEASDD